MRFKQWFILTEAKEDKQLALELADGNQNIINELNTIIPQGRKETDQLTLLAAYYYSKHKNIEDIKNEFSAYVNYFNNNRMPLITVNHITKEPNSPWNDYIHWTQVIHGHQGEDAYKLTTKQQVTDIDFQNEKPMEGMTSADGKIKVYKANSPQQCIILGKGKTFCISQPGNRMWQGYRDTKTSTFYFVFDDEPPDDRLGIVVVDRQPNKFELTDKVNRTGRTIDPYTKKETNDPRSYIDYLKSRGIDVTKFENIPKTPEEIAEDKKLGNQKHDLLWFQQLTFEEKSKYIGRGHMLTDEQFDYLWVTNLKSLLEQYVKTGLKLNKYQVKKIEPNRDLKDNYIHNRLINNQQSGNFEKYEYELLNDKQKEKLFDVDEYAKVKLAIKFNRVDILRSMPNLTHYSDDPVTSAAIYGSLDVVKYFVEEKKEKIKDNAVEWAAKNGHLDVLKYLVDEKDAKIGEYAVQYAAAHGHLDVVKYLVGEKNAYIGNAVHNAGAHGHLDVVKYFIDEKKAEIGENAVEIAAAHGQLAVVKYLVDEKDAKIKGAVYYAVANGHLDVVKYLVGKGAKIGNFDVVTSAMNGHLNVIKYLVGEKGAEIGNAVEYAAKNGHLDIVKYLVDEEGAKIGDSVAYAVKEGHRAIAEYLRQELAKRQQNK